MFERTKGRERKRAQGFPIGGSVLLKDLVLQGVSSEEIQRHKAEATYGTTPVTPQAVVYGRPPNSESELPLGLGDQVQNVGSIRDCCHSGSSTSSLRTNFQATKRLRRVVLSTCRNIVRIDYSDAQVSLLLLPFLSLDIKQVQLLNLQNIFDLSLIIRRQRLSIVTWTDSLCISMIVALSSNK